MKTKFVKLGAVVSLSLAMSACIVAPQQPVGYRMTSSVLPTYVNGQYVGMQPSNYGAPTQAQVAPAPLPSSSVGAAPVSAPPPPSQQSVMMQQTAPVYLQSAAPSVVYIQAPTPAYTYNPYYYSPMYVDPFYGVGLGVGIGLGFGYYGGWGWHGGRHGHR